MPGLPVYLGPPVPNNPNPLMTGDPTSWGMGPVQQGGGGAWDGSPPGSTWEGNSGGAVTDTSLGGSSVGYSPTLGLGAFGQGISQPPSGEAPSGGGSLLPLLVVLVLVGGVLWWRSRT